MGNPPLDPVENPPATPEEPDEATTPEQTTPAVEEPQFDEEGDGGAFRQPDA